LLIAAGQPHDDRVAVDHARDLGAHRRGLVRCVAVAAPPAAGERERDQHNRDEDGDANAATVGLGGGHPPMMIGGQELSGRRYGMRRTVLSSVSLIWPMISSAWLFPRCQTLRPKITPEPPASMIVRVWLRTVSSSVFEPPESTTRARPADS